MSAAGYGIAIGALGADIGPHTGIFAAWWSREDWSLLDALAFECSAPMAVPMLRAILSQPVSGLRVQVAGIEAFVARGKSVKLQGVRTAQVMAQVGELRAELGRYGVPVIARPAGTVKPWATDKRLAAAGLLKLAGSSPHIKDAGRHMLFSACQAGLPDPLSRMAADGSVSTIARGAAS